MDQPTFGARGGKRVRAAVVLLCLLCACGGASTEPTASGVWRRYALVAIDGAPPPAVLSPPGTDTLQVLSDTLILGDTGWVAVRTRIRRVPSAAAPETLMTEIVVPYSVDGGVLTLGNGGCGLTTCAGLMQGTVTADELWHPRFTTSPMRAYRYVRTMSGAPAP